MREQIGARDQNSANCIIGPWAAYRQITKQDQKGRVKEKGDASPWCFPQAVPFLQNGKAPQSHAS